MSRITTHLISNNVRAPGFGPPDSRSVPCSGVSRSAITFSSGSSLGERCLLTRVKFICRKRVSNAASVLCGARPGNNWRDPDFNKNWNEDEDNNDEGPDESDILDSKNGTLFSSASSMSEAYALPGQTEKEIHEFFVRKVEPKLRERTAGKDVHMAETVEGKYNEVVESIMNVLRSDHFSQSSSASNNSIAAFGPKAISNTQSEDRSRNHFSQSSSASNKWIAAFGPKAISNTQSEDRSRNHFSQSSSASNNWIAAFGPKAISNTQSEDRSSASNKWIAAFGPKAISNTQSEDRSRNHFSQSSSASNKWIAAFGPKAISNTQSEDRSRNHFSQSSSASNKWIAAFGPKAISNTQSEDRSRNHFSQSSSASNNWIAAFGPKAISNTQSEDRSSASNKWIAAFGPKAISNTQSEDRSSASNKWIAAFGPKAISNTQSEDRSRNHSIPNREGMFFIPEPKATSVSRSASISQRRSPLPKPIYQLIYSSDGSDSDLGEKQQPELDEESESDEEFESEQDLGPGPISSTDVGISAGREKGKRSEEENSLDE